MNENLDVSVFSKTNHNKLALIDTGKLPHKQFTYGDLDFLINNLAFELKKENFQIGSRIGILSENSVEFFVVCFALLRLGIVSVPINYKLPAEQINYILQQAECNLVYSQSKYFYLVPEKLEVRDISSVLTCPPTVEKILPIAPEKNLPAFILWTSGSTSRPRGAVISHQSLGWKIGNSINEIKKSILILDFIHLVSNPLFHLGSLTSALTIFGVNGTIAIYPSFSSDAFIDTVLKYKIISFSCVPSILEILFRSERFIENDFSCVEYIKLSGSPLTEKLLKKIKKAFPKSLGNISNNYGLTEVGANIFGCHPYLKRPQLSVGYPRRDVEYRLENNVLSIRSPSLMNYYLNEPQLTKLKFTPDGFFITNDLFRIDENGFYYFIGRADDMIVCGGENIYLSAIDEVLASHPNIEASVSVAVEDEVKFTKPYSFIVLASTSKKTFDPIEFKNFVESQLPLYSCPRQIWQIDEFPVTSMGKIDRRQLIRIAHERIHNKTLSL